MQERASERFGRGYRLPAVTGFSQLSPSRARTRDTAYTPKGGNQW